MSNAQSVGYLALVDACLDKNCPIGAIFVPELHGKFIATRKFYQTSKVNFCFPAVGDL